MLAAPNGIAQAPEPASAPSLGEIDEITVMPVAFPAVQTPEDRRDRLPGVYGDVDEYVYKGLMRKLAMKGYVLAKPRGWERPETWSAESLRERSTGELAALLPADVSFAVFLLVEQLVASKQVVRSSASTSVAALIVHRPTATVVWANSSRSTTSENVLSSAFIMWLTPDRHMAVEKAFATLFTSLPDADADSSLQGGRP